MAALRAKVPPVGSASWILNERQQASQFVEQEAEEFSFSVRNEVEWLNEHMAEIFTRGQLNVADIFKTPGKLRGKTPRTARKRNPLEARAPLTDIFAPNPHLAPSPSQTTQFYKQVTQFQVAEDSENQGRSSMHVPQAPILVAKANTDSGYYGLSQDEMESDQTSVFTKPTTGKHPTAATSYQGPVLSQASTANPAVEERRITEESFVSAREVLGSKNTSKDDLIHDLEDHEDDATVADDEMNLVATGPVPKNIFNQGYTQAPAQFSISAETASVLDSVMHQTADLPDQMELDDVRSPSDGSSPVKALVRKSSLTFAPLPGREPLASKKSVGNRISRTSHVDHARAHSQFGRFTGGKSLGGSHHGQLPETEEDTSSRPGIAREESETTKLHNKTSTQRLHERINALGQSKDRDSSKANTIGISGSQPLYPSLTTAEKESTAVEMAAKVAAKDSAPIQDESHADDEDDDWIAPIKPAPTSSSNIVRPTLLKARSAEVMERLDERATAHSSQIGFQFPGGQSPTRAGSPSRPFGLFSHGKSNSVSVLASPSKAAMAVEKGHSKAISVSNPNLASAAESTTPAGSPTGRRYFDGPLSASKAKVSSLFKSAKEKLIYTAGLSAQVKLDALSPGPSRVQRNPAQDPPFDELLSPHRNHNYAGPDLYPNIQVAVKEATDISVMPSSPLRTNEPRRTRSSTEREEKLREKAAKDQLRQADELEKLREKERQKATAHHQKVLATAKESVISQQMSQNRPGATSRADTAGSQDEVNSADEMPPPPAPKSLLPTVQANKAKETRRLVKPTKGSIPNSKPPPVIRVALNSRLGQPSTLPQAPVAAPKQQSVAPKPNTESLKPTAAQRKAAEQAKKKREEELAAQRRAEERRKQEQERAAKLAEERKIEQQRREQREQEARRQAQKAAAEAKQRAQAARPPSRQTNNLTNALQQEKQQIAAPHPRADLGASRPVSRMNTVSDLNRPILPHINPTKPAKRPLQPEAEEQSGHRPPLHRAPPSGSENKRRKTNDLEEEAVDDRRSVKAPPIRQSNVRKEPSRFTHGYMAAPTPGQHTSSLLTKTLTAQHHNKTGHPNDMATISTAKIPFADAPNPAAGHYPATYKTPARGPPGTAPQTAAKSSPQYPNGENIALPEIATDSEDEDSDNEFNAPSWTDSPALRELLTRQQLVDPEQIFGPIAPLQMEEIFKNKDRHKRFRDRTSSANWSGSDRLTEEERRRDREARERLMRDGGWTFQTLDTPRR